MTDGIMGDGLGGGGGIVEGEKGGKMVVIR